MGADDRQFGKIMMQAFHIGKWPGLNVEHDRLRIVFRYIVPKILTGIGQANRKNRKVRAESACKRIRDCRIFFKNNYTLRHKSPFLQPSSTARVNVDRAAGWLGDYSTDKSNNWNDSNCPRV